MRLSIQDDRTGRVRAPMTLLALAALGLGGAGAQDLAAYNALAQNLDGAVTARGTSAQAALTRLDAAQSALDTLAPTIRNRQIVSGLKDALGSSRAALGRTPAELEAQVLLARGLMRKALYDQTLSLLSDAPANGAAQLQLLGREFGLNAQALQVLGSDAKAGRLERTAWRLQRAAVQKVSASLASARPTQSTASYVNLARATSWFTVVQDSAGAGELKVSQFGDALRQLTSGDTAALGTSLTALRSGTAAFAATLATPPAATPAGTKPAAGGAAPTVTPVPVTPGTQTPDTQTPATQSPATQSPATQTPAAEATAGAGAAYVALGRALAASGHADNATAREALAEASAALAGAPAALRNAAGFDRLQGAVSAAQGRSALRPTDVQALIASLANVENAAAGRPVSALDGASAGVSRWFSGWLRVLIFALLAGLTVLPLYLLNLAFGGRNTYWRAIMVGLGLLMLPLFLEGLFGLLGAFGDLFGAAPLRNLLNLTLSQGAYALPVWAVLSAAALGLMAFGFRGLCEQFGLLGTAKPSVQNATQHTSIDWDEEV
ncbi:hypothetical protein GCM10008959_32330 [Deinococcus seoulensis]|uniref:Uncharacterized protein n=1 Tax=Deinococcus seoulensis TaxID=1837379 RepID=A0ABQ2RYX6_9DEIO|nr:hypothetical protein [Deinococcus seoulensis]GGR67728.1 hypothetical protein GCM10008959_32330 [Deinococcus seoulensis]